MFTATICKALLVVATLGQSAAKASSTGAFVFDDDFDDYVEQQLKDWHVPGLSLAVIDNGRISAKGYGYSNLPSTKATADTLWFTGSTTKAFTAAAAAAIVHDNEKFPDITWKTPVNTILPDEFVLSSDYSTFHTTLEDALSHRSGLPRHDLAYGWNNASMDDILKTLRHLPMTAQPRTRWQYCNLMFGAAGRVVEKLTGKSLEQVLHDWFWEPLGMDSTMFSLKTAHDLTLSNRKGQLARGYWFVNKRGNCGGWQKGTDANDCFYTPEPYLDISPVAGAGSTISSVNDYALWIKALLAQGKDFAETENMSKLDRSMYHAVMSPRTLCPEEMSYGSRNGFISPPTYSLGWISRSVGPGYLITFHPGGLPGFGTNVYLLPNEGLGFVSMANTMETSNIAGEFIFSEVLRKHFAGLESFEIAEYLSPSLGSSESRWSELTSLSSRSTGRPLSKKLDRPQQEPMTSSPLPRRLSEYVGIYTHPAYGLLNITCLQKSIPSLATALKRKQTADNEYQTPLSSSGEGQEVKPLLVTPSKRMWDFRMTLEHTSQNFFRSTLFLLHGPYTDDPVDFSDQQDCDEAKDVTEDRPLDCKKQIAWDSAELARAVFEDGPKGAIDRLGIEMEEEMVANAEEDGGSADHDWREGMIWFERQS